MDQIETLKTLPHLPGVYLYRDEKGSVLYIGKAKDLKKRVSQYWQRDAVGDKTTLLVSQIHEIKTIVTDSEFDALMLESKLIREHLPKYNAISRDDKSPLYIAITTKEALPRILWLRKTALSQYPKASVFGPFQSGKVARTMMRHIRRIIPYCTSNVRDGRGCFYTHLGLCEPCPSVISKTNDRVLQRQYNGNIRKIISILSGRSLSLLHRLEKEMETCAKQERYEEAQKCKLQIEGVRALLARHFDPHIYLQNETLMQNVRAEEAETLRTALRDIYPSLAPITRIECIDISNIHGKHSTGSLVVLLNAIPSTSDYRRFKIRTKDAPNDTAMIAEVLRRRLKHTEWPYPQLLVVDGGKGQVAAAVTVLGSLAIPVIGFAKRFEEIIVPMGSDWKIIRLPVSHKGLHLLQRIRDESHRFALRYHRLLRSRAFLEAK